MSDWNSNFVCHHPVLRTKDETLIQIKWRYADPFVVNAKGDCRLYVERWFRDYDLIDLDA